MRRTMIISVLLIVIALLLPLLFLRNNAKDWGLFQKDESSVQESTKQPEQEAEAQNSVDSAAALDETIPLTAQIEGENVETTMADYLPGVLAAEMPASFELEGTGHRGAYLYSLSDAWDTKCAPRCRRMR